MMLGQAVMEKSRYLGYLDSTLGYQVPGAIGGSVIFLAGSIALRRGFNSPIVTMMLTPADPAEIQELGYPAP
jgi:hypothetical protein